MGLVALSRGRPLNWTGPVDPGGALTAAEIRASTGPNPVTDPGGGITCTSITDLNTKIAANSANSLFVFAAGTYTGNVKINDIGLHPRIYFLGDPETTVINGASGAQHEALDPSSLGGEIHGGKWLNWGNSGGDGVTWHTCLIARSGWTFSDFIVDGARNRGVGVLEDSGSGIAIRRGIIRNSGRYGLQGTQQTSGQWGPQGALFEDIEISGSNTRHLDPLFDAGGAKFASGFRDSIWRRIWTHDNYGSGLWWDGSHSGNLAEDIVSEDNRNWGGFVELGFGSSTFRRWHLFNNAEVTVPGDWVNDTQFLVSCVDGSLLANDGAAYPTSMGGGLGVELTDSVIDGTTRAMGVIVHDQHPINSQYIRFLRNEVWLRDPTPGPPSGHVGGQDTQATKTLWTAPGIQFDLNEYHAADVGAAYWKWDTGSGVGEGKTWAQWQAFGFDADSTLVAI